jgi:hydrogenase maturation protease
MNFARADAIAKAVLYEGYNLYPYRPSALKNRQRWTVGGVFPREWSARATDDRSMVQTQCLLRGGRSAMIEVRLRFLHIVAREIGELPEPLSRLPADREPAYRAVGSVEIDDVPLFAWEEAREREVAAAGLGIERLRREAARVPFAFAAERMIEPAKTADGMIAALIIRAAHEVRGEIVVAAEPAGESAWRITVQVENTTPLAAPGAIGREAAQRYALASAHVVLGVEGGGFVSLLDPPAELAEAARRCDNRGLWPVLVGEEGAADLLLAAPIILYDYPRIAPESPGDLFDGCEIDEILTLRILTLTDAEKREIAAADPRSRAMLERTEALTEEELARLHGTFRDALAGPSRSPAKGGAGLSAAAKLSIGDRVRLKPKAGGDIMDVVLKDQIGVVEAIERDFEDRVHVAVTILDDPGRDLGIDRMPGHRFFFGPDEIEPIGPAPGAASAEPPR